MNYFSFICILACLFSGACGIYTRRWELVASSFGFALLIAVDEICKAIKGGK